jgi:hypothetical protein
MAQICHISQNFFFKLPDFFMISEVCSPNLAKPSYGWSPIQLYQKIEKKTPWCHPYVNQKRRSSFIIISNLLSPLLSMIKVQKHTKFEEQVLHQSIKSMIGNIYFIHVITYNLLPWQK